MLVPPSMLLEKWHSWCQNWNGSIKGDLWLHQPLFRVGFGRGRTTCHRPIKSFWSGWRDMNAALMVGNPAEAARVSGVITDATRSLNQ